MTRKVKTIPQLKKDAVKHFNAFIRSRDQGLPCISCGSPSFEHAGHFYSGGHYEYLRFDPDNVHGQCLRCNYFLSGNLNQYRINLEKRIGKERLQKLDDLADYSKRVRVLKRDRFFYEDVINTYKLKIKEYDTGK